MLKIIFLVFLPLAWSYGEPHARGAGAFVSVDSFGNRYGGTYGLKDGQFVSSGDAFPVPYADTAYPGEDFGASYFANLENLLQEAFKSSIVNQRLAFDAAKKAFDLSSNQAAGYHPNLANRFGNPGITDFPGVGFPFNNFPMPNFPNSAYASAAAGPGFNHHVASIYPSNPGNPNVDQINHYSDTSVPNNGGFYAVSSNSFASSSNVNGKETTNRGAETVVNDNGKVTHYKVGN